MVIYHGSRAKIEKPKVKGSDPTNDYGPSFYLTLDLDAAKSWACKDNVIGVVNKYTVSDRLYKKLRVLDLTDKSKYSVLNWVAILMHFRILDSTFKRNNELVLKWLEKYYINVDEYDVVIGFRADDSYFLFPLRFVSNDLSFEDLENVYLLGDLGIQYAFMSEKSINLLKFDQIIECDNEFLGRYPSIVDKASKEFNELLSKPRDPKKTYVLDLMRKDNE